MKKRKKKKGRKSITETICYYGLEILDWELPYSFSINSFKDLFVGPYWEHASLKITGKVFQPKNIENRVVEINIMGDRRLIPLGEYPEKYDYEPKGIGTLTIRGKQSELSTWVPFDALHLLMYLLKEGEIKFLTLSGQYLYRGSANITSINFEKAYNPADWE